MGGKSVKNYYIYETLFKNTHSLKLFSFLLVFTISLFVENKLEQSLLVVSTHVITSYTNPNRTHTNEHLVIDKNSGRLYLGGTNGILQLSAKLEKIGHLQLGPYQDNLQCFGYRSRICPGDVDMDLDRKLTDNFNKILLIYNDNNNDDDTPNGDAESSTKLIHCGSVFQGICSVISNLDRPSLSSAEIQIVDRPIVANDKSFTSFGFIAPGPKNSQNLQNPQNQNQNQNPEVLYVATSFTGNSEYRHNIPSISTRIVSNPDFILDYAGSDLNSNSNFNLDKEGKPQLFIRERKDFPVKYIFGFSSNGFSYFLSIQKRENRRNSIFVTKIIRLCQNDLSYNSYAEIPMECRNKVRSTKYPLVTGAFLGKAGKKLKRILNLNLDSGSDNNNENDDVLYASFSKAQPFGSAIPGNDSALCVYPIKEIQRKFQENIQNCFDGRGMRGLDFIKPDSQCIKSPVKITEDFCGLYENLNSPFGGEIPISAFSMINIDFSRITAVAVKIAGDYTVGFLGTNKGKIKKLVLGNSNGAVEYGSLTIEEGHSIKPDLIFDASETHLFALTAGKVSKISLHSRCSRHSTCEDCTGLGDPFCGWCPSKNRCTIANSCLQEDLEENETVIGNNNWISYENPEKCSLPEDTVHCPDLASNCFECSELDPKFGCGWCTGKSNCLKFTHCPGDFSWLSPGQDCSSSPEILSFFPMKGPVEGGTNLTINLANFREISVSNVYLLITVAGVQCVVNNRRPSFTLSPGKITCTIRKSERVSKLPPDDSSFDSFSGPLVIRTPELRIESRENFTFLRWNISQIFPNSGPIRGGTNLKIFGDNLDVGKLLLVYVGEVPCYVTKRDNETIQCTTQSFYERGTFGVRVQIDGNEKNLPLVFNYVQNPVILRTKQDVLYGNLRGGTHVTAEGRHFDGVQDAYFVVTLNGTDYLGLCNITTPEILQCLTPAIDEDPENLHPTKSPTNSKSEDDDEEDEGVLILPFKFLLDTVETFIANRSGEKHAFILQLNSHHSHDHDQDADESSSAVFATLMTIFLILLLLAIVGFFLYRRHKKKLFRQNQKTGLTMTELQEFQNGKPKLVEKGVLTNENPYVIPYNSKFEVPERRFTMDVEDVLGSGAFGIVTRGTVDGNPVAVKTLKSDAQKMHLTALMSELKILIHLGNSGKHPNIVNLVGANTKHINRGQLYMFVEYCPLGSLEQYLRKNRGNFYNQINTDGQIDLKSNSKSNVEQYENSQVTAENLCTLDLINYAFQVSRGMEYLASKNVIHADLACRNLLLKDKKTVKITDFGLARKLYDYTNYVKKHQEPLPWRWMAIESLRDLSFSSKSDCWAYGITLWEIFTCADMPYPGLSWTIDFSDRLQHGLQNTKPKFATNDIYNTMRECWKLEPDDRPSFSQLRKYFNAVLNDSVPPVTQTEKASAGDEPDEKDPDGYLVPLLKLPQESTF